MSRKLPLIRKVSGRRYVSRAWIRIQHEDIVLIEIDMHLKRPDVIGIVHHYGGDGKFSEAPGFIFSASEDSYFRGKKIEKASGEIGFPAFAGWKLHDANRTGRYTISATLIKETP